jgi:hypothetical protein
MIVEAPFGGLAFKSTRRARGWQAKGTDIDIDQVRFNTLIRVLYLSWLMC